MQNQTEKPEKFNFNKLEKIGIITFIVALVVVMLWSSGKIKERREDYAKQGRVEQEQVSRIGGSSEEAADPEACFNDGVRFARAGRFDEAIQSLNKAIELNPLHYRAMSNLGLVYKNIYLENNNEEFMDKAIELYKKAIEINPYFSDAYNNLGDAYFNIKKYPEAEKEFKEAIKLDPLNVNAYNNLGVALIMQDKKEEAVLAWRQSLTVDRNQPMIVEYISRNEPSAKE